MREAGTRRCHSRRKSGNAKVKTILSPDSFFVIGSTTFPLASLIVVQKVVDWKNRIDYVSHHQKDLLRKKERLQSSMCRVGEPH